MSKMFYAKLAVINIKKNGKTYFPYILTCISTIIMFYILCSISVDDGLNNMSGGGALRAILIFGDFVIGLFSIIFLFYTNSFLIKRRKKELGLYNILGMEKRHIAKVLIWETFFVTIISMVVGLIGGILLSKLMFLVLLKLLNFTVPMGFSISVQSLIVTAILFGIIFVLTLINNLRQIHLSKPIELLKGGEIGEKEPKTKWILTLFGVLCIVAGYYIALTTESPLGALNKFFLAVILVIIGTYSLFTVGSIALLKILRKNKKFYYKTNNFINISGMIYRMKQNAVGLANICILSTAVLVMLSTTFSLYIGMDDLLRTRYPRNIAIIAKDISNETSQILDSMIAEEADKLNISQENIIRYRSMPFFMVQDKNSFQVASSGSISAENASMINLMPLSEYNSIAKQSATLNKNEVLLFSFRGEVTGDSINISGNEFKIKERINSLTTDGMDSAMMLNTYYVVVPDEETIQKILSSDESNSEMKDLNYYYAFDTGSDAKSELTLTNSLNGRLQESSIDGFAESVEEAREPFFSLYGGLFFLGIFLGALFIMATVLIIYYKQISEGYDDKNRFEIMQKVGMSKAEVKKSIKSQVLMVFFLPLVTAVIHIAFAFKVITKLLSLLNLTNIPLFAICTVGTILVFAIFYAIVYYLTARVYYKIVS